MQIASNAYEIYSRWNIFQYIGKIFKQFYYTAIIKQLLISFFNFNRMISTVKQFCLILAMKKLLKKEIQMFAKTESVFN